MLLTKGDGKERKPLVVVHGFLASKMSFKPLFNDAELLDKRDCYLIDLRNGEYSDWHDENSYELILIILIPTSFIEYSLYVIFELAFFLDGFLIIPGKDAQLFKKNAKIIKTLKLFFKKIIY